MTQTALYLRISEAEFDVKALEKLLAHGSVKCLRLDLHTEQLETWQSVIATVRPICHAHDVAVLVTNHVALVMQHDLDGVHLTHAGVSVPKARESLGRDKIIGAYAATSRHTGMGLAESGADYVSFGPVWRDPALSDQEVAVVDTFAWWQEMIEIPVVAEGGMTPAIAKKLQGVVDFLVLDLSQCKAVEDIYSYIPNAPHTG